MKEEEYKASEGRKLPDLVVTRGGIPFADQREGIRQFLEACQVKRDWHEKPPPDARSVADAMAAAERMRTDLPKIVQVHATDWDRVILADEVKRLSALSTQPQAPQGAVKWEEVGTLHVQHYLNAPEMENREYVPIVDLPPGSHKLYAAIEAPAGDKK